MPNTLHARIGPRDLELLTAIDRFPVTSAQLCRISLSFKEPFRDENNLRRRLRSLTLAGFIRSFPYAVASDGRSPRYFKLTREGYRFLYGSQAAMPKRRYFQEIRPGHHHHTLSIAELMTHLIVCGHRLGHTVQEFAPENSVCLQVTVSDVESKDVPSSSEVECMLPATSITQPAQIVLSLAFNACFGPTRWSGQQLDSRRLTSPRNSAIRMAKNAC